MNDSVAMLFLSVKLWHKKGAWSVNELQERVEELESLFELRHKADLRGIAKWRAESPSERELMWPDHGDMVAWLLKQLDEKEQLEKCFDIAFKLNAGQHDHRFHGYTCGNNSRHRPLISKTLAIHRRTYRAFFGATSSTMPRSVTSPRTSRCPSGQETTF